MDKLSTLIAAVLLWLVLGQSHAQDWELKVCADPNNLPYTNRQEQGFDNRIAQIIAEELNAQLSYVWYPQGVNMVQRKLREGDCDLILGVGESYQGMLSTLAYYQSTFVMVYREGEGYDLETLDDEVLRKLRRAAETPGIPPYASLLRRDLSTGTQIIESRDLQPTPPISPIVDSVARKEVDVAILWGPIAGYFSKNQPSKLKVVPVLPEFELPSTSMIYAITMIVRPGDDAFRDRLNYVITRRWEQIRGLIEEFSFPEVPLPQPVLEVEE